MNWIVGLNETSLDSFLYQNATAKAYIQYLFFFFSVPLNCFAGKTIDRRKKQNVLIEWIICLACMYVDKSCNVHEFIYYYVSMAFFLVYLNRSIDSFDTISCSGFFCFWICTLYCFPIFVLPSFAFVSLAKLQTIVISWTLCSCCLIAYGNFKTNIDIDTEWSMVPLTLARVRFRSYGILNPIFCCSYIILNWLLNYICCFLIQFKHREISQNQNVIFFAIYFLTTSRIQ